MRIFASPHPGTGSNQIYDTEITGTLVNGALGHYPANSTVS
jgi:hypothetical protein